MIASRESVDILIVEDSPTQAQRLEHVLREQQYRVRHAPHGRAALEMVRAQKPDMIISDVMMPEMDGYELCQLLKSDPALSHVPVILVTTLSDPSDVIRGLECRADNFIVKPYDEKYLLNRVQYILLNRDMQNDDRAALAVKIHFNGRRHVITADRMQILNLLLSTYEAAIQRNRELTRSKEALAERSAALARRERELDDANRFLEHLIAASPSVILRCKPEQDFLVTYVSPNVATILGYSAEEVVGIPGFWSENIHPADRAAAQEAIATALDRRARHIEWEYRRRTKQGAYRWFWTRSRIDYDQQGHATTVVCNLLDVTARKEAEEETRRAESFLNSIVENVPSTIFVKDVRQMRYVRINRAFEELLGRDRSTIVGKADPELFPPELAAHHTETDRAALESRELLDIPESRVRTAAGGERLLHTRKLPIFHADGSPGYLLGISEDVTERRKSEEALANAKLEAERANRAKSEFLSRMSHELRTPLNAILGFAQLLDGDALTTEQQEGVRHILEGGAHLLALINEVLDIARIEAGHLSLMPEPIFVRDAIGQVVELVRALATQRGIAIHVGAMDAVPPLHVTADRQRLSQILLNLLSNAVKYNRESGTVTVTFDRVEGNRVAIRITDTGPGIPQEKLQRLFEPFERLGAEQSGIEGTGLGLAVSRALVAAMGGTLGVDSKPGRGSTFWIELPSAGPPEERSSQAGGRGDAALPSDARVTGTVLYVEDNPSNWRLMQRVFARRPGVRLVGVARGQAALEHVRASPPDLMLLDLHLPDMPGEEVLALLSGDTRTRDIPVVVLSADAMPAQIARLLAMGAMAYLTKPIDVQEVLRVVDNELTSRSR